MDNVTLMKAYSDKCFGLAPVDPEYGIGESNKNHASRNTPIKQKNGAILRAPGPKYKQATWDNEPPSDIFFEELFRVSRNQIIWGANYFRQIVGTPFKPPRRNDWPNFIDKHPTGWIIWDKVNGDNDFNDCELAWTSYDRPTYILPYMWNGMMQAVSIDKPYVQQGNKSLNERRIHPHRSRLHCVINCL